MRLVAPFSRVRIAAVAIAETKQTVVKREPASKAAAILAWSPERRGPYIPFFLTRTVKASLRPHVLEQGRVLAAFKAGGSRADDFERFMKQQRVDGVLGLQDGRVRLERYLPPHSQATR